ncbi:MAG TPA: tetratricopeptide repeat protein [Longimicrobium sp.]|jgi:tetratricopeptide (TPR) repeat protein
MANIGKLRDQARAYEQRDQWREAIGAYRQILESPEGGEVDIALWNRIGDMHLRLNETDRAVEAYEAAVSAYVEVGLYNNAIALCRKILRLVPGRINTYRRLGQISAAKGFLADARQNFLEYADRMRRAGKLKESFEGLKEFADLSPDDIEVRRLLADQLLAHGERNEAVVQLRTLLGPLIRRGDEEAAEAVRAQIREIDALASIEPLAQATETAASDDFDVYDGGNVRVAEPAAPEPPAPAGFEIGAAIDADDEPVELPSIEGLEVSMDFSRPDAAAAPARPPVEEEPREEEDDLPLLDFDAVPDPSVYGEVSLDVPDEQDDEPLPLIDDEDALPMLDMGSDFGAVELPAFEPEPAPPVRDRLEQLRSRVATNPEDAEARDALIDLLHERGAHDEVPRILDEAHRALAAQGLFREAVGPISQLIRLNPGEGHLLQKRVEYAFRSGDRSAMVDGYLALARFFETGGSRDKARAVYGRVLEIEAYNPEARSALEAMDDAARRARAAAPPPPPPPPPPASAPAHEYVDLGALILGDEDERAPTTRFIVEEKEPTGDEDRDFADMLAHFRQKVAENIEAEDSASHYDLGLAFKEMGLIDEAIAEFQVALRGGANPLATLEVLGQCFVEKGQYPVATRVLERALRLPDVSDAELVGVLYLLGRSHEELGNSAQAVELYERVLSVDIRFRDAAARADALRGAGRATGF